MDNDKADTSPAASTRADAVRERMRLAKMVADQSARARAAGDPPSDAEAARLVTEFQAQGGRVTVCPPADHEPTHPGNRR